MIAFAYYLLKVFICSAVLFLYYKIALQGKEFHQWNRFYLLIITVLSLVIPCLEFPIMEHRAQAPQGPIQIVQVVASADQYVDEISVANQHTTLSGEQLGELVYILISIVFAFLFVRALLNMQKLIRSHVVQTSGNVNLIETDAPGTPFSFFRYIFWNPDIDLQSETGRQILQHEMIHVQQKHSLDKLLMKLILILFWCNPVFWLIRKELSMIHEFIADRKSVGSSGATALAAMILQAACPGAFHQLTNPFFKSSIKRRLAMLTKNHNPRFSYIARLMALPVLAVVGLAFTLKTKEVVANAVNAKEPITVVIDAGHGYREGNKPDGARVDGIYEDDLVLEIAKRIKEENSNKNLHIILTRTDKNIVNLEERVRIAAEHRADLFISLHVAALPSSNPPKAKRSDGMEVFISGNNLAIQQRSELLGSALIDQLKLVHKTFPEIIKREKIGVYVLDKNTCPAVLVECGYMTNKTDMAFIKREANQKAVAQAILNAIERYAGQINSEMVQESVSDTIPNKNKVFLKVEQPAQFPGGENALVEFLKKNLKSSVPVANKAPKGTYNVMCRFIINENGKLSDFTALTRYGYGMEEEALRVIRLLPNWIPAVQNGHNVATYYTQPISFVIEDKGNLPKDSSGVIIKANPQVKSDANPLLSNAGNIVFEKAEEMPQFPGGIEAWARYLQKNCNATVPVTNGAPAGTYTVLVRFIVDQSGSISAIEPLTKKGYGMEEEVIRLIEKGPKWVPAKQNGHIVTAYKTQPITFVVAEENNPRKDSLNVITKVSPQ
ncbi:N-acetylmuramoyl-L-alanine amidase [Chitinophagaceae bacterium LB-8]|uniref:N-acetylmuramoyl-L-alanine amidase n=1 Tax=Paraflavisolibacter caeni TaxID=2982496 RepID=A0A9X3B6B7_9BACT|nr:N-acetylmuramoyl-L-alanine amidase [Paraflavisolibacter caeni]MCU7547775.1 N-acetylmuramoyl-L-alanine amidase [Paraflavisolibacter caeni]